MAQFVRYKNDQLICFLYTRHIIIDNIIMSMDYRHNLSSFFLQMRDDNHSAFSLYALSYTCCFNAVFKVMSNVHCIFSISAAHEKLAYTQRDWEQLIMSRRTNSFLRGFTSQMGNIIFASENITDVIVISIVLNYFSWMDIVLISSFN